MCALRVARRGHHAPEVILREISRNLVFQIWDSEKTNLRTESFRLVPFSPQTDITKVNFYQFKVRRDTQKMSSRIRRTVFFGVFCCLTAKCPRIFPDLKSKNLLVWVPLQNSFKRGRSTLNPLLPPFHSLYTKSNPTATCAILRNIGSQNSASKRLNPAMFSVCRSDT